jgi:hypothetical protein
VAGRELPVNKGTTVAQVIRPGPRSHRGHSHPDNVQILLTDLHAKATSPDGKATEGTGKAGDVHWRNALQHAVENTGDKAFEGILVEMKGKPTDAKTATGK